MEWKAHHSINTFSLSSSKNTLFNFRYCIDHSKICKAILQMFQDFVGDYQAAFLVWQLHDANNNYQRIYWYFIIILFSQNFLSVFCTHTYEHIITQTQPGALHHIICSSCTAEAESLLWVTLYTGGWIHSPYTSEHKQNYTKNHAIQKCFTRASRLQFKNIYVYHLWNSMLYFEETL